MCGWCGVILLLSTILYAYSYSYSLHNDGYVRCYYTTVNSYCRDKSMKKRVQKKKIEREEKDVLMVIAIEMVIGIVIDCNKYSIVR